MKRTTLSLAFLFSCFSISIFGQTIEHQWGKTAGESLVQDVFWMDNAPSNGIVSAGYFGNTVDFDPGPGVNLLYAGTGFADASIFVQKLNDDGDLEWVFDIQGDVQMEGVYVNGSGNTLTWGNFEDSVDFDPGPGSLILSSGYLAPNFAANAAWIQKVDNAGNLVWAKHISGSNDVYINGLAEDPQGNVYATGYYREADTDFDPGPAVVQMPLLSNQPMFILKLDVNGDFVWVKQMEGTDREEGLDIATDSTGNIYLVCEFEDSLDVDLGPGRDWKVAPGAYGIAFVKMNGGGDLIWSGLTERFDWRDNLARMQVNDQNELVFLGHLSPVAGVFYDTIDVDPGPGQVLAYSTGGLDAFVQKLDSNGNLAWRYPLTGSSSQFLYGLDLDEEGGVYFSGHTYNATDFDPGPGNVTLPMNGGYAGFIGKLDVNGNFVWVQSGAEMTDTHQPNAVAVRSNQTLFWGGSIFEDKDLDPGAGVDSVFMVAGPENFSQGDAVVARWLFCPGDTLWDSVEVCMGSNYTFPDGSVQTNVQSPVSYTSILNNFLGCDTNIVTLLNPIPIDLSVSSSTSSITANATNASYQWLDCSLGFTPISGATSSTFTTSASGSFAVEITQNGCQDTSVCTNLNPLGRSAAWEGRIDIFPNPTAGNFKVRFDQNQNDIQALVTNALGQVVFKNIYENDVKTLDLNIDGPKGLYFLKIRTKDGREARFPVLKQ